MRRQNLKTTLLQFHDDGFGGWAHGTVWTGGHGYSFETKHFEEGSVFGIDGGRISKLRIVTLCPNNDNAREVCAYDRGWCVRPDGTNAADMAACGAILERYN